MYIHDKTKYDFVKVLEDNWETILEEYRSVADDVIPWPEKELNPEENWKVYPIYDWPSGDVSTNYAEKVPFTASLIKKHVPTHGAAGFSRLPANNFIPPHEGFNGEFLRVHLGLIIPEGDLGFKVVEEFFTWEEGKCQVFDDRPRHYAWNSTDGDRVILMLDFVP